MKKLFIFTPVSSGRENFKKTLLFSPPFFSGGGGEKFIFSVLLSGRKLTKNFILTAVFIGGRK